MKQRFLFCAVLAMLSLLIASCASSGTQVASPEPSKPDATEPAIKPETESESESEPETEILDSELCQEGQALLYNEDFEDENAQGWYNVEETEWSYEFEEGRGTFLTMSLPKGHTDVFYLDEFENAVWLFDLKYDNSPINLSLNWHYQRSDDGKRMYYTNFASGGYLQIHIAAPGVHEAQSGLVESENPLPPREPGDWQHFAFAYFDGRVDLWIDDAFIAGEQHTDPFKSGGFGLSIGNYAETISIDNVVVCSLEGPYQPQ